MAALASRIAILLGWAMALGAHAISVSVGEVRFEGQLLKLKLRVPRYEAEHLTRGGQGASKAAEAFRFGEAKNVAKSCTADGEELICELVYQFAGEPPESLAVEARLARVTVPNHVHIMRLERGKVQRQAIFDRAFEKDTIAFRQPSALEEWWRGSRMGAAQVLVQPALVVLLLTVALLRSRWPYLAAGVAAFLVVLPDRFYATPAFFELATGLAIAYLALEARFFPEAGMRWLPLALVGAVEGAALAVLARPAGAAAVAYGGGNLLAQGLLVFLLSLGSRYLPEAWRPRTYLTLAALGLALTGWVYWSRG